MLGKLSLVALAIVILSQTAGALAQPSPATAPATLAADEPASPPPTENAGPIAATVNGEPIYAVEVEKPFEAMQQAGRLGKEDPRWIKARMLAQLVDRKVANQVILGDKTLYTDEEIENQLKQLRSAAQNQGATLEQLAAKQGLTLDKLRQDVIFRIATQKYVQKQFQTVLPEFIRQHQAEFDGTEIHASHIMLRPGGYTDTFASLSAQANAIREEIASGKIDFAAAAQKYSQAPSAERGGDIGFVPRRGVMLEPFAATLFQLKPGEVSQPVATPLGVHLIQAGEVKRGTKDLKESLPQIQQMAAESILKRLVDDQRSRAKIEFTGTVPHFKPGTEELAAP